MGFGGFQAGVDLGRFNLGASGVNIVVGITGGLLESTADELIGSGSFKFQVPFVGGYAAATWGNFFADAMLREDFYRVTPPLLGATTSIPDVNGNAFNIMGEVGYRFDIGNYFVEPSAGLVFSHLSSFSFTEFGLGGTSPGLGVTLTTNQIDSLIGRAGVRVGTTVTAAGFNWQPFLAASVWDEFEGNTTSSAVCNCFAFTQHQPMPVPDTGVNISSTRVGVFGQFGGGTAIQIPNTPWLGFIRGDYRTGDDIHGWDVVGGIRYQFLWAAASPPAAPMVTKAH
jgi:outer membrane autotransporter protein